MVVGYIYATLLTIGIHPVGRDSEGDQHSTEWANRLSEKRPIIDFLSIDNHLICFFIIIEILYVIESSCK